MKCHGWCGLAQSEGPVVLLANGRLCRDVLVHEAHWLAHENIEIGPGGCGLRMEEVLHLTLATAHGAAAIFLWVKHFFSLVVFQKITSLKRRPLGKQWKVDLNFLCPP